MRSNRQILFSQLFAASTFVNGSRMSAGNALHRWYRQLCDRIDQQIVRLFHCAVPSGLNFSDFDLEQS